MEQDVEAPCGYHYCRTRGGHKLHIVVTGSPFTLCNRDVVEEAMPKDHVTVNGEHCRVCWRVCELQGLK